MALVARSVGATKGIGGGERRESWFNTNGAVPGAEIRVIIQYQYIRCWDKSTNMIGKDLALPTFPLRIWLHRTIYSVEWSLYGSF